MTCGFCAECKKVTVTTSPAEGITVHKGQGILCLCLSCTQRFCLDLVVLRQMNIGLLIAALYLDAQFPDLSRLSPTSPFLLLHFVTNQSSRQPQDHCIMSPNSGCVHAENQLYWSIFQGEKCVLLVKPWDKKLQSTRSTNKRFVFGCSKEPWQSPFK